MPNYNKRKGTAFEYDVMHALEMLSFYVIRAYSSIGVADLVASPPKNKLGESRPLLIQCKNTVRGDYMATSETMRLMDLADTNAGEVIHAYKVDGTCRMREIYGEYDEEFSKFMGLHYGIVCKYGDLLRGFRENRRPEHLLSKRIPGKVWYPHVPKRFIFQGKQG